MMFVSEYKFVHRHNISIFVKIQVYSSFISLRLTLFITGFGRFDFAVGRSERKTGDIQSVLLCEHLD